MTRQPSGWWKDRAPPSPGVSPHDCPPALAFQLEGKLAGPWLRELEECWQSTLARQRQPILRVDLTGVTFVSAAGKACLAALHSRKSSPNSRKRPARPPRRYRPRGVPSTRSRSSRQRLGPDSRDLYREIHRELDRLVLPRVLEYTGGNQQQAALLLGITRRTLRAKLQDVGPAQGALS